MTIESRAAQTSEQTDAALWLAALESRGVSRETAVAVLAWMIRRAIVDFERRERWPV